MSRERIKIPIYAKVEARKGLQKRKEVPKSKKFGLDVTEAKQLGINSGVARARKIINSNFVTLKDAKSIKNFYNRFKNCKTFKCEGAIQLWGGRKFGQYLTKLIK